MKKAIISLMLLLSPLGAAVAAEADAIRADAPDRYTVVPGDTLWGISGRFLKDAWRWPEVWRLNRDEIRNPHLIYPGQVIMLDRSGPWLTIGRRVGGSDKLQPQVYNEQLDTAVPSIPLHIIEPFLNKPLVIDQARLEDAATIVAIETSRVLTGSGDTNFAICARPRAEARPGSNRAFAARSPVSTVRPPPGRRRACIRASQCHHTDGPT